MTNVAVAVDYDDDNDDGGGIVVVVVVLAISMSSCIVVHRGTYAPRTVN